MMQWLKDHPKVAHLITAGLATLVNQVLPLLSAAGK